jgi:CO/xanthine dehydrogenase FAD-binding subunit
VNPVPTRVAPAEGLLRGEKLSELLIREAARRVKGVVEPTSDIHASAEYRAAMAEVYARRALQDAWARARQGT